MTANFIYLNSLFPFNRIRKIDTKSHNINYANNSLLHFTQLSLFRTRTINLFGTIYPSSTITLCCVIFPQVNYCEIILLITGNSIFPT